jgi:hypothetical protein
MLDRQFFFQYLMLAHNSTLLFCTYDDLLLYMGIYGQQILVTKIGIE